MLETENASTTDPADPPVNQPGGNAPQPSPLIESDVATSPQIESDLATEEELAADPPESQSGGG